MKQPMIMRQQAQQLDRCAAERYGLPGIVLMENAGRGVVDRMCQLGVDGPVVICAYRGNNGGDGFVVARHLDLRGHDVRVWLFADPGSLRGDALANYRILEKSDISLRSGDLSQLSGSLAGSAWVVDALLGTGAMGEPRPPLDTVIDSINASGAKVMAIDVPSGLDCDTGQASQHTIRAAHTCTFVARKPGFVALGAAQYTGQVHVVDIGAPRKLVEEILSTNTET
ncbi:MAG TPA: NAD(P)H-hydrate epimerase [Pirellulales bacterium]|nr:NAD(P)H-hydrate epimerase [Pirellulales bacterium]